MKRALLIFLICFMPMMVMAESPIVTGFYPVYRTLPESYDYSRLTHLFYFSLIPKGDGGFSWTSGRDSLKMYNTFQKLIQKVDDTPLATHQKEKTKLLISIGGTSEVGSGGFNEIAADSETTKLFVSRVKNLLDEWGADGVDIDWEKWLKTKADSDNHEAFLKTLADTLRPAGYLIFTDVSASNWSGQWFNLKAADYVDYIQPMAYTFSGSWSSETGHNSSYDQALSALNYWVGRGVPKNKLVLGVPFYGIGFGGTDKVGEAFSGNSSMGQYVNYTQVLQALEGGLYQHSSEADPQGPYIYRSDDDLKEIIFYNDTTIMGKKADYLLEKGYAGAMIWELGQDSEGELSLLDVLASRLLGWEGDSESVSSAMAHSSGANVSLIAQKNSVTIALSNEKINKLELYDMRGRMQKVSMITQNSISTDGLGAGLYFFKITTDQNRVYNQSFLK